MAYAVFLLEFLKQLSGTNLAYGILDSSTAIGGHQVKRLRIVLDQFRDELAVPVFQIFKEPYFVVEALFSFGAAKGLVDFAVEPDSDACSLRIFDLSHVLF